MHFHSSRLARLLSLALLVPGLLLARDFEFFQPLQPARPFQVMAHRGTANQAPENTRPALQRCIEDGLEWAEVDVRLTRDSRHVLSHDARIAAPDGTAWKVSERTLVELQLIDLGSPFAARYAGEHALSLADALALAKGRLNLYLDCKSINPEQLAAEILAAGMEKQVVVFAEPAELARLHAAGAGRLALMTKWHPDAALPAFARTNHLAMVEIDAPELTPEVARSFHALGVKVQAKVLDAWDTPAFWDRTVAAGADYLQTDLPEEVIAHALWQRVPHRPVRVSLHRGANRYAPENTVPAFEKAIRLGVDFVEFDVRTTSDGKYYLLHDSTLDGKTDGHGPIAQTSSEAIAKISAGVKFGERFRQVGLPTLEEFLTAVQGKIDLYFDAKAIPPEVLSEAVERHGMAGRTVVYQSADYLARLKAINPRIRSLPPLNEPKEIDALAATLKPYAVDADWNILSRELIARCHALGILVFSDALGAHERIPDYLQAMEWGIDVIQTDHPLRVLRAIELFVAKK